MAGRVGAKNNPYGGDAPKAIDDRAIEDLMAGKGRPLTAGEDVWTIIWWNCEVRLIKEHRTPYEVASPGSPGGRQVIHTIDSSREAFMAQLPPADGNCAQDGPTQEELDAARDEVNRRHARPGVPPPPDVKVPAKR